MNVFAGIVRLTPNIAAKGTATQSSEYGNTAYPAYLAIDESFTTQTGDCAVTSDTPPSWWQVELLDVFVIAKVAITGRSAWRKCPKKKSLEISLS